MPEELKNPNTPMTIEEQEAAVGAAFDDPLKPKKGFMALDESGAPTGEVLLERPEDGPYISVSGATASSKDVLTTPTGAPISGQMNPDHSTFDPALAERNAALAPEPAPAQA